ncbi:hypothetical protein [Nocardia donostiensis]|uniref:hypothetical protein n=1 Tax=Nocardia donostiensis TaxID=1538463 RepID=UPI001115702F|nr:hypothetical protein [Nocardia donostiensis]
MARLTRFAERRRVDLRRLVDSPPPTPALWALLDTLAASDVGYLLVPSPAHFDGLGVSRHAVLRAISAVAPDVRIIYVDPNPGGVRSGLLVEVDVPVTSSAADAVALRVHERLSRSGLSDAAEPVRALVQVIVADAAQATEARSHGVGSPERVRVEVRCPPDTGTVLVEFFQTQEYTNEPMSSALQRICATFHGVTVRRFSGVCGGTVTRCAVLRSQHQQSPVVESGMGKLADAVHRYVSARGSCPLPAWVSALPSGRRSR